MQQKHLTLIAVTGLALTLALSAATSALAAGTSQTTTAIDQTGNPPGGQPSTPQANQGQTPQTGQQLQPCSPSGSGTAQQPGQQQGQPQASQGGAQSCSPQQPEATPLPTDVPAAQPPQPPQPANGNPNGIANPVNTVPLSERLGIDCSDVKLKSPLKTLKDGTQKFDWSGADGLTSYRVNLYRIDGPIQLVGVYDTSDDDTDLKADLSDLSGDKFEWEVQGLYKGQVVCTTAREDVEMED